MTKQEFFGCAFIALGPPLALFLFTIAHNPLRILVLITSGFFWLLSLLLSSILWFAVVPLRENLVFGLVFSVIFQEVFRFFFYKLLRKADAALRSIIQEGQSSDVQSQDFTNKQIMAYVSGLGYGVLSGVFSIVNVLADMSGPGTVGIFGDSQYFFITSAFLTLCFILLHMCWGIIYFYALDKKKYMLLPIVMVSHMLVSCLTLLNQHVDAAGKPDPIYLATLLPAYGNLIIMAVIAFNISGGSIANIKKALTCTKTRYDMN